jgi:hypothetical protein
MRPILALIVLLLVWNASCRRCEDIKTQLYSSWQSWLPYGPGDFVVFSNGLLTDTLRITSVNHKAISEPAGKCTMTEDLVEAMLFFDSDPFDTIQVEIKTSTMKISRRGGMALVNIDQPRLLYHENSYADFYASETIYGTTYSNVLYLGDFPDNTTSIRYAQNQGLIALMDSSGYLWVKQ